MREFGLQTAVIFAHQREVKAVRKRSWRRATCRHLAVQKNQIKIQRKQKESKKTSPGGSPYARTAKEIRSKHGSDEGPQSSKPTISLQVKLKADHFLSSEAQSRPFPFKSSSKPTISLRTPSRTPLRTPLGDTFEDTSREHRGKETKREQPRRDTESILIHQKICPPKLPITRLWRPYW